ncbi:iron-containing alcohol dehydrogenase [Vulgatibacter sp.]|uniref:iron-containing alcohol dehydrogenase n=1 Tax=Vulgatibacter sp. TaxID=1971226 RepID=UPI003567E9F8
MPTYLSYPTRVVWGAGTIIKLGEEVRKAGGTKVLVVSDRGVIAAGLVRRVENLLSEADLQFSVFSDLQPNPVEADVWKGVEAYRALHADIIVAIGGGAPLDTARAIRLAVNHPKPLSRYDDAKGGDVNVTSELPPLICIATTSGTGSEVSRSAVVKLDDTKRKTVLFSPRLIATCAIADPELTLGLPPKPTAWTGMDAFTHCLEAYVALGDNPLADALAIDGIHRVTRALPAVMDNPNDLAARADMMAAAIMGAMAFTKGLGAAHAIAHAVGAIVPGAHHGLVNAIVLPAVCRYNEEQAHPRFARIAEAMGEPCGSMDERKMADRACTRVEELCRRVGIPEKLSAAGVTAEMIPQLVELALDDASHRTNPRPFTREDCEPMLRSLL